MRTEDRRTPVVLFRRSLAEESEFVAASRYFNVIERRTQVPRGSLVIPRYSALPFNKELADDVETLGGRLINSHVEHRWIADIESWYARLRDITPQTWFHLSDARHFLGPFVLKGQTNSKKHRWSTHMYAEDWEAAIEVHDRLLGDGLIGSQKICIRQYVPLRKLCESVCTSAPPVTEEYRFFVLDGKVLCGGFYWSAYLDDIEIPVSPAFVPAEFLADAVARVKDIARFLVIDIARTESGRWIVVELNDGQQSGLCGVDPNELYSKLHAAVAQLGRAPVL